MVNLVDFQEEAFQNMITAFAKTLSRTPVTKTTSNASGDETLTDGTPANISAPFFRKEDDWMMDKPGLIQNADAIVLILPSLTINKDDKLTYDSETYRVQKIVTRRLGTVEFYEVGQCFKI